MRVTRLILAGVAVAVATTSCGGSGGLSHTQRSWCEQYPSLVIEAHNALFGRDAISEVFWSSCFDLMAAGDTARVSEIFQQQHSDTYDRACLSAYESR